MAGFEGIIYVAARTHLEAVIHATEWELKHAAAIIGGERLKGLRDITIHALPGAPKEIIEEAITRDFNIIYIQDWTGKDNYHD